MVAGVPLGSLIGEYYSWRIAFGCIFVLAIVSIPLCLFLLPNNINQSEVASFSHQMKVLINPHLMLGFLLTVLGFGSIFICYTYMVYILKDITHLSSFLVSIALCVYGMATAIGNILGGKLSNNRTLFAIKVILALQCVSLFCFTLMYNNAILTFIGIFCIGFVTFFQVPALQLYIMKIAEKYSRGSADIASALNISAFNIGITLGSFIGAIVVSAPCFGLGYTPIVASAITIVALIVAFISQKNNIS
jgi:DHA1 family inner membrane transport protein